MYLRADHAEHSLHLLRQFIHDNPLGVLTTFIPSSNFPSLQQTHIPWVLDDPPEPNDNETNSTSKPLGILRGHLARSNPHAKALIESATTTSSSPLPSDHTTVLFTSASSHYITPHFYTTTKPTTGKVVPTYNYAAVQAYGRLKVFADHKSVESGVFLQKQIEDLTREAEARAGYGGDADQQRGKSMVEGEEDDDGVGGESERGRAWEVTDAPTPFIEILKKSILGVELEITSLQGKWKMSQELKDGDRQGVVEGLKGVESEAADEVGRLVGVRHEMKKREKELQQQS